MPCDAPVITATFCSIPIRASGAHGEMAETPPSIRKSAPTTYVESSDAR
jgi:hypothetical protein